MTAQLVLLALSVPVAAQIPAEVSAILNESCVACHNDKLQSGKLRLDSPEAILAGGASGATVVAGASAQSPLYTRVVATDTARRMPPAGERVADAKAAILKAWIDGGAAGLPQLSSLAPADVDFSRDVEPVLKQNCYGCHAGAKPRSQLRLDRKSAALRGGIGGVAIVPGKADASRLIARVEGRGGEQRMPLGRPPLSLKEVAVLRSWIDKGAVWPAAAAGAEDDVIEKHWSYRKPVKPAVPGTGSHPIDAFLAARLAKEGLKMSPEASRETLLRRVTLDLTGLPPTTAELDAFVADTQPGAYERAVDRLLASPAYGERWARPWLDAARYADTNGFEKDLRRTMWKYRDWVIDALNRDMPFDQFTVEQIAGDLLPNPTPQQRVATGFHRNSMLNTEGGVDEDEAQFEVLLDRVNTTAAVWLGSTLGCTQCHNHKYDPFTQKEYYQMMAFFNHTKKAKEVNGEGFIYREPSLDLATPEQEQKRAGLKARIDELDAKLKTQTPSLDRELAKWEAEVAKADRSWKTIAVKEAKAAAGAVLSLQPDGSLLASGPNAQRETFTITGTLPKGKLTAIRLEALPDASLPRGGPGRDVYGNFIISSIELMVDGQPVTLSRLLSDDGRVNDMRRQQVWSIDASREDKRLARQLVLVLAKPLMLKQSAAFQARIAQNSEFLGQAMGRFRLSATAIDDPSLSVKPRASHRPILAQATKDREKKDQDRLAEYFRGIAPSLASARDELKSVKSELDKLGIASAMVMEEVAEGEPSDFLRERGGFSAKAEKVRADTPATLHAFPSGAPRNRLGLAQWLVSRDNPLTPRVIVNRIWEQYFGRGIVETVEDFGTQGAAPSHPELLDWLAVEFMDSGWSMKKLHRLIVTSAAYKQTSRVTPELLKADPYNRLLARGPRFRMEAEMIRDSGLAASGLLAAKVGGPSVFPPQPPGVWDIPYNDDKWETSKGDDRYRRGLYTFVRRSAMYPAMLNFDAVSREVCVVRRARTSTPLQALTTLNDEAFFEMAQALARRLLKEAPQNDRARVDLGYRLVAARKAKPNELDSTLGWLDGEKKYFAAHPEEAAKLAPQAANPAEQAAYTMLANVLLNLDEALTKE